MRIKTATTIYSCDNCKKILSVHELQLPHFSINLNKNSGWVSPENNWKHTKQVVGIKQFCNGECLKNYFENLVKN